MLIIIQLHYSFDSILILWRVQEDACMFDNSAISDYCSTCSERWSLWYNKKHLKRQNS